MLICRTDHRYFLVEMQLWDLHKMDKIFNCKISLPADGGYPLVRPLNAPIEETDDAAEVALPNWVADPE